MHNCVCCKFLDPLSNRHISQRVLVTFPEHVQPHEYSAADCNSASSYLNYKNQSFFSKIKFHVVTSLMPTRWHTLPLCWCMWAGLRTAYCTGCAVRECKECALHGCKVREYHAGHRTHEWLSHRAQDLGV